MAAFVTQVSVIQCSDFNVLSFVVLIPDLSPERLRF